TSRAFGTLQTVGRELGLQLGGSPGFWSLSGVVNDVPVSVEVTRDLRAGGSGRLEQATFAAGPPVRIPANLVVRRELGRGERDSGQAIGDEQFDRRFELPHLDAYICAALSSAARRQLSALLKRGGELSDATLSFPFGLSSPTDRGWLVRNLRSFAALV